MTRVERWERRAEDPLLLLALAFMVAYAWPVLDPRRDSNLANVLRVASWAVWAALALDFLARTYLADRRASYVGRHWYDVALILLPMLRPLRLLRLLALARVLNRTATSSLVGGWARMSSVRRSCPRGWRRSRSWTWSKMPLAPTSSPS